MHYWLGLAKSDVSALGFTVLDSQGPYATQYSFFDTVERYNPDMVIADGHGSPNSLTGQAMQEVLRACVNNQALSGKVMCALSCLTGQNLGPDSRNKNAMGYMGFVNEFTWVVSQPYNPAMDPVAVSFQEVVRKLVSLSCLYQQALVPLKDVYNGVRDEFEKWKAYYSIFPGSEDPYARDILLSLVHDQKGLITLGKEDEYAQVYPGFPVTPIIAVGLGAISLLPALGLV